MTDDKGLDSQAKYQDGGQVEKPVEYRSWKYIKIFKFMRLENWGEWYYLFYWKIEEESFKKQPNLVLDMLI